MSEKKEQRDYQQVVSIVTIGDLKKALSELPEEADSQVIRFWGDEYGSRIVELSTLTSDFINPSGEGVEPLDYYKQFNEGEAEYLDIKDEPVVLKKGTVVLSGDERDMMCPVSTVKFTDVQDQLNYYKARCFAAEAVIPVVNTPSFNSAKAAWQKIFLMKYQQFKSQNTKG